jgi:hypothetical protein
MVIQRILRHANVSTTATYYIKTAADDVRNAMVMLENHIAEAAPVQIGNLAASKPKKSVGPDNSRQAARRNETAVFRDLQRVKGNYAFLSIR